MALLQYKGADGEKMARAIAASRERHPVAPVAPPNVTDPDALRRMMHHLPGDIPLAARPIELALRHTPVKLARGSRGVSPSFDALLHLALLASGA